MLKASLCDSLFFYKYIKLTGRNFKRHNTIFQGTGCKKKGEYYEQG